MLPRAGDPARPPLRARLAQWGTFKQWPQLVEDVAHAVRAHNGVLDGEICSLEPDGRTRFNKLLFRRDWPHFYALDVLSIEGRI